MSRPKESFRLIKQKLSRRRFLQAGGLATIGAFSLRDAAFAQRRREMTLFIGTYTSSTSEGIYTYRMNSDTGELTKFTSIKSENPSFLTLDRSRRFLYAVNEVAEFEGKPSGAVSAYSIDRTGTLKSLNQQPSMGADPCHLSVDRRRTSLLVANYTGGSVALLPIMKNGTLGPATDVKQHEGSGPKEQQKGPHAHCIILDSLERHAIAADLGSDRVLVYRFDPVTRKLHPGRQPSIGLQAGAGPRHLTLHPNGRYAYVNNDAVVTAV